MGSTPQTAIDQSSPTRSAFWRWLPTLLLLGVLAYSFVRTSSAPIPEGWKTDFHAALLDADAAGKPLLVAFHMEHCPPCGAMKRRVLTSNEVQSVLERFVAVEVDVDREPEVAARFGVMATPTYAVITPDGRMLAGTEGYHSTREFIQFLELAAGAL